jgi:hypothetical protein
MIFKRFHYTAFLKNVIRRLTNIAAGVIILLKAEVCRFVYIICYIGPECEYFRRSLKGF